MLAVQRYDRFIIPHIPTNGVNLPATTRQAPLRRSLLRIPLPTLRQCSHGIPADPNPNLRTLTFPTGSYTAPEVCRGRSVDHN
jgi:hypothetical protein